MMNTLKAQKRLQDYWNSLYPDEPMKIEKVIGKPQSRNAVGWTWTATDLQGVSYDLGYTEKIARTRIKYWNEPLSKAGRNLVKAMEKLVWSGTPHQG